MFNEYEIPVLINALDEYAKIAVNVHPDIIKGIKSKLVALMDGDTIGSGWSVEDVFSLMFPDEDGTRGHTEAELKTARRVLSLVDSEHDANAGINWETLGYWLQYVREEEARELNEKG
jgi:hypothetical protein